MGPIQDDPQPNHPSIHFLSTISAVPFSLPDADLGIPNGVVAPVHGRESRIGTAPAASASEAQRRQRDVDAVAYTLTRPFDAHAPRCLVCTCR